MFVFILNTSVDTWLYPQTDQYKFEHLTTEHGLSHNNTNINFTGFSGGFIWIGTNRGLDRYDGYEITQFEESKDLSKTLSKNQNSLPLRRYQMELFGLVQYTNGLFAYNPVLDTI